ncbi:alpha/beta hydrolase family protein [Fenollaria sporofastidiosus]|uniref:alpha/beta hydrolase family protein n=1 Tax=Fenollaria sporofastidiosus TaxID=2811778 RepID=UPI001C007BA3|nr:alpha/beta hydrolase [Fenollaria sporofastidiosus]
MKRKVLVLLLIVMSLSLISCAKKIDDTKAKDIAESCMQSLRDSDGKALFKAAKLEGQKQITEEDYQRSLDLTMQKLGKFIKSNTEDFIYKDDRFILTSYDEFEYRDATSIIELDKAGTMVNSYFVLTNPKCEVNDDFEEKPFTLNNGTAKMYGIICKPKNPSTKAIVVMLQGSGPQDMDETIGLAGNKPFKDIAHGLAKLGIATLRYDKRYVNNAAVDYTIDEEIISDAKKVIDGLKEDKEYDEVYLLGHSLGAMVAPKIAREEGLKKVAMLSASTMKFTDIIYNQQLEYLNSGAVGQAAAEFQKKELDKIKKQIDEMTEKTKGNFFSMPASYVYSVNQVSPVEDIKAAEFDVFIAHGSKDFQVKKDELDKFEKALNGREHVIYKLYEGLNHMMMPEDSDKFSMDIYDKPNNVSDDVINDLAEFFI